MAPLSSAEPRSNGKVPLYIIHLCTQRVGNGVVYGEGYGLDRVTVAEAAARLGISKDAVRQRIRRGTIEYEKDADGSVYVLLSPESTAQDTVGNAVHDVGSELVEELRDRVRSLEDQLSEERAANRENRRLLAAALERIPAIEAPDERESPETPTEEEGRVETPPDIEPRSWWRRFFGFE